jgi:hypothetical protein
MKMRLRALGTGAVLGLVLGWAIAGGQQAASTEPMEVAVVRFEQNATDGDVEVVFEAEGDDDGLAKLTVVAPNGRTIIDFTAPDASKFGMRQFRFESPEPKDVSSLKAAFPEGEYKFSGVTPAGVRMQGKSKLSHALPPTSSFRQPAADAKDVPAKLEIAWSPVKNAAGYILELEQSRTKLSVTANLPASETQFAVPDGLLRPGLRYQLGIGAVAADGNVSFVETHFTTAGQP